MTFLIPAYQPDKRLLTLIDELKTACDIPIVIVDDGSGPASARSLCAADLAMP